MCYNTYSVRNTTELLPDWTFHMDPINPAMLHCTRMAATITHGLLEEYAAKLWVKYIAHLASCCGPASLCNIDVKTNSPTKPGHCLFCGESMPTQGLWKALRLWETFRNNMLISGWVKLRVRIYCATLTLLFVSQWLKRTFTGSLSFAKMNLLGEISRRDG